MKSKSFNQRLDGPKSWLMTGLMGASAVAYVVFVFLPLQRSIDNVQRQIQDRREQILQAQSLASALAQSRLQLSAAREVSRAWRSQAPRQTQLITHSASLTQQASEAGIAIDRLDPLPPSELNLLARQTVTMQFHAPFPAVFDFVRRLEMLPGSIWIRELRLHASDDSNATLRAELTLTIFADRSDYTN
jgi:Tfp pilus assembly protein PilO